MGVRAEEYALHSLKIESATHLSAPAVGGDTPDMLQPGRQWASKHFCDQAELHRDSFAVRALKLSSCRTRVPVSTELHTRRTTGLTVAEREANFTPIESVKWSREERAAFESGDALLNKIILLFSSEQWALGTQWAFCPLLFFCLNMILYCSR